MMAAGIFLAILLAGAAQAAPAAAADPCTLLTAGDIQAVQNVAVKETKRSETQARTEQVVQCLFATSDFSHSVSLSVVTAATPQETKQYWLRTFVTPPPKVQKVRPRKKEEIPGRRLTGIGSDAYWTGDGQAGSLYVLADQAVLRISVGGVQDPEERLRRSQALAEAALRRLRG